MGRTVMSDGGKGSTPRPYSVGIDEFNDNFERIFGVKTRVSGVPYEVELPDQESAISVLELENKMMRARMDRLEDENRRLEEEIVQLRIRLHNSETTQGQH
jgi:predicted RNase H-like nuclease (RuvC/YqgF family)